MHRIVFFGLDGPFSTIALQSLSRADLRPTLVVLGKRKPEHARGERVRFRAAQASLAARILGRGSSDADPDPNALEDLSACARGFDIDVLEVSDPAAVRARARIHAARADAFVVAGFHRLIAPSVLALSRRGGLNVHPGALPAERGPSPVFWALKAGRTSVTYSIHMLERGEDSGDIISTGEVSFDPGTDGQDVHALCARSAAPQLIRAVRGLLAGELVRTPQSKVGAGRCPRPEFKDGRIDPSKTAEEVFTFVKGCSAYYPLFAECGGDRFFIKQAISHDPEGTLSFEFALTGDRLVLRCSPGVVEMELKPEGALFTAEYVEET